MASSTIRTKPITRQKLAQFFPDNHELVRLLENLSFDIVTTLPGDLETRQPLDATLTALAGLVTAADKLLYATGLDTFATSTLTAFARSVLAAVDAAAMRAAIGAGTGSGDVAGPGVAVADHVATFNGTTGKLIKDSGLTLSGSNTGDQFTATTAGRLLGRGSAAGAGAAQEITLGSNLSMSGTTLNATPGAAAPATYTRSFMMMGT